MNRSFHHLYLTGYRGTGKTCVGQWLAETLARPAIDLDERIETAAGMTIREIFEREGEAGFRDRETAALQQASAETPSVISLGGGAILRAENRRLIAASGHCVWLQADADTIMERIKQDITTAARRPSLTTLQPREEIITLMKSREPFYSLSANSEVDVVSKSVATIGNEILVQLKLNGDTPTWRL